jgi:hypothetical protein
MHSFRFALIAASNPIHPGKDAKKPAAEERGTKHHEIDRCGKTKLFLKMNKSDQP